MVEVVGWCGARSLRKRYGRSCAWTVESPACNCYTACMNSTPSLIDEYSARIETMGTKREGRELATEIGQTIVSRHLCHYERTTLEHLRIAALEAK